LLLRQLFCGLERTFAGNLLQATGSVVYFTRLDALTDPTVDCENACVCKHVRLSHGIKPFTYLMSIEHMELYYKSLQH